MIKYSCHHSCSCDKSRLLRRCAWVTRGSGDRGRADVPTGECRGPAGARARGRLYDVAAARRRRVAGHRPVEPGPVRRAARPRPALRRGRPDGRVADVVLGPPVPSPARSSASGSTTGPRRGERHGAPPSPPHLHQVPELPGRTDRDVPLSGGSVDYEVEIVVVIGADCSRRRRGPGLERRRRSHRRPGHLRPEGAVHRLAPPVLPGQELRRLGPTGPAVVSVDAFDDPDDIALWCEVRGEVSRNPFTASSSSRAESDLLPLVDLHAVSRRPDLHRDTRGVGMARGRFLAPGDESLPRSRRSGSFATAASADQGAQLWDCTDYSAFELP